MEAENSNSKENNKAQEPGLKETNKNKPKVLFTSKEKFDDIQKYLNKLNDSLEKHINREREYIIKHNGLKCIDHLKKFNINVVNISNSNNIEFIEAAAAESMKNINDYMKCYAGLVEKELKNNH